MEFMYNEISYRNVTSFGILDWRDINLPIEVFSKSQDSICCKFSENLHLQFAMTNSSGYANEDHKTYCSQFC